VAALVARALLARGCRTALWCVAAGKGATWAEHGLRGRDRRYERRRALTAAFIQGKY